MCDSYTFSVPNILLASNLIIVQLVLHIVPYPITEDACRKLAPEFAISDTASVLVHYSLYFLYLLPPKSGVRVWVWGGYPVGVRPGLFSRGDTN